MAALVDELSLVAGSPFSDRWNGLPPFGPRRPGVERLIHPRVGEPRLTGEALALVAEDGQRLVVHLPADDATSAALDRLTGRQPGSLRVMNG